MAAYRQEFKVPRNPDQPLPTCYDCDRPATRWVRSTSADFSAPRCYWHANTTALGLKNAGHTDVEVTRIGPEPEGLPPSAVTGTMPGDELAIETRAELSEAVAAINAARFRRREQADTAERLHDPFFSLRTR